jgi:hypothetical protein
MQYLRFNITNISVFYTNTILHTEISSKMVIAMIIFMVTLLIWHI